MPLENPEGYGEQSSLYHFYSFVPTNSGEYPLFHRLWIIFQLCHPL